MKTIWNKMVKKIGVKYLLISLLVIILIVSSIVYITNKNNKDAEKTFETKTITVTKGDIQDSITGSGTIEAIDRKEIQSECTGTVETLYVEKGQQVEKEDLLLTMDTEGYDLSLRSAQLSLQETQNNLTDLQRDQKNLTITAPVSGTVGDSLPVAGAKLGNGSTFTSITDENKMQIQASFNLTSTDEIVVGQGASIFLEDYLQYIDGTVSQVSYANTSTEGHKTCNVTILLANPGRLTTESSFTVSVPTSNGTFSAVQTSGLEWENTTNVNTEVSGTVKTLYVSSGQWVEKGQILAKLVSTDLDVQIRDQMIKVQQSQISLEKQQNEMDERTIYAPISGTVIDISITEGEEVTENNANLVTLSCQDTLTVTIPVDELDILKMKEGQKAIITSDAIAGTEFSASVTEIAGEGVSQSGVATFDVTLQLDDPGTLKAGMNVNAEIIVESREDVITLPLTALTQRGKAAFVLIQGNDTPTQISIGLVTGELAEVTSGLNEGDVVVYQVSISTSDDAAQQETGMMMPGMGGGQRPPEGSGGNRQGGSGGGKQ